MSPLAWVRARRAVKHELPWSEALLTRWKDDQGDAWEETRKQRLQARVAPHTGRAES